LIFYANQQQPKKFSEGPQYLRSHQSLPLQQLDIQIPKYSVNIEKDGDRLSFEIGSPIPAITAFYNNHFLAIK
jgi:hypothetical protein